MHLMIPLTRTDNHEVHLQLLFSRLTLSLVVRIHTDLLSLYEWPDRLLPVPRYLPPNAESEIEYRH